MRRALASLALSLLAPLSRAGELVVPTDHPTLAAAVAAAAPGDTIVVSTAASQNQPGGVVVDKALTILGDPVCRFDLDPLLGGLVLAGPGAGEVTLAGVTMGYPWTDSNGGPALSGGGFSSVRLVDCTIVHDNQAWSGVITDSYPAVDLTGVASVQVLASTLLGGPAGTDGCYYYGSSSVYTNGRAGLSAPGAVVTLVDGTVTGGRGGDPVESFLDPCPAHLGKWGGQGGDGVVALDAYAWGSTVTGGLGVTWKSWLSGSCGSGSTFTCGKKPDGAPFVVSGTLFEACSRLAGGTGRVALGAPLTATWDPAAAGCEPSLVGCSACTGVLFVSLKPLAGPISFAGGWVHLAPVSAVQLTPFLADQPQTWSFTVPPVPALVGLTVSLQAAVPTGIPSGPTSALVTY